MPISATGISTAKFKQQRHGGFTLLEVMVTLVLIGIITSFAILSIPGDDRQQRLHDEAKRLATLLELNRQEAVMLGQQRGVLFSAQGYAFRVLSQDRQWQPVAETDLLRAHSLPAGVRLQLTTEGRAARLAGDSPQIMLLSSGEATDFEITLSAAALDDYKISGDLGGAIRLRSGQ